MSHVFGLEERVISISYVNCETLITGAGQGYLTGSNPHFKGFTFPYF
jgi:hypothetical protein